MERERRRFKALAIVVQSLFSDSLLVIIKPGPRYSTS